MYDAASNQFFQFIGDDDVWVFINEQARHRPRRRARGASTQYVDLNRLGLTDGETLPPRLLLRRAAPDAVELPHRDDHPAPDRRRAVDHGGVRLRSGARPALRVRTRPGRRSNAPFAPPGRPSQTDLEAPPASCRRSCLGRWAPASRPWTTRHADAPRARSAGCPPFRVGSTRITRPSGERPCGPPSRRARADARGTSRPTRHIARVSEHTATVAPVMPEAQMNLVNPKSPVVGTRRLDAALPEGQVERLRPARRDRRLGHAARGELARGPVVRRDRPGRGRERQAAQGPSLLDRLPQWGEDGEGNVISTTPKRVIDEFEPQKPGDDPDDHRLFVGVCSNYLCDLQPGRRGSQ